jgi:hypothetical protein
MILSTQRTDGLAESRATLLAYPRRVSRHGVYVLEKHLPRWERDLRLPEDSGLDDSFQTEEASEHMVSFLLDVEVSF